MILMASWHVSPGNKNQDMQHYWFFSLLGYLFFCIDVAMSDIVHDVESIFHLHSKTAYTSRNLSCNMSDA